MAPHSEHHDPHNQENPCPSTASTSAVRVSENTNLLGSSVDNVNGVAPYTSQPSCAPGLPSSMTNEAKMRTGEYGSSIKSVSFISVRHSSGVTSQRTYPPVRSSRNLT